MDMEFENGDAEASLTELVAAGSVKRGRVLLLKGKVCKVIDMSTAQNGKHGHTKTTLIATDLRSGDRVEDAFPSHQRVEAPFVKREHYIVLDVNEEDGFCDLLSDDGETTTTMNLPTYPEDLSERIVQRFQDDDVEITVTVTSVMGVDQITSFTAESTA